MKVSVNLPQTMDAMPQSPAPVDASFLDCGQSRSERTVGRIAVDQAHDAFGVTDQFANAPNVKAGSIFRDLVDFHEVVAKRPGARHPQIREAGLIADLLKIVSVRFAFSVDRQ